MIRLSHRILAAATALTVLSAGAPALAAEAAEPAAQPEAAVTTAAPAAISVQLDGENLTFTDAAPQVQEERTFLPFRAVFEAMGAVVDYAA